MLARAFRFHGYGSLKRTYQQGQTVRGQLMSLRFSARSPGRSYRVAVVVSRKVHKSAVTRNRIRRRVYEQVRLNRAIVPEADLVFTVFSDQLTELPAAQLQAMVRDLLTKTTERLQKTA